MFGDLEDIIWTNIDTLTLRCDLDLALNAVTLVFFQKALWLTMMSSDHICLLKNQHFIRYNRKSHILIINYESSL